MSAEALLDSCTSDYKKLNFRLYYYKVLPCTKPFSHDWQHCPFTHPNDKARRRSPLQYSYSADMCPAMLQSGKCPKGVNCDMAHNLFEYHLHPDRYKTKMCRDGAKCGRIFCFFAHSEDELRSPFSATAAAPTAGTAAAQVAGQRQIGSSSTTTSSSSATNTPMYQPTTPSSSPGHAGLIEPVAQQYAVALNSSNGSNGAELIFNGPSGSGSEGLVGPAARQFIAASRTRPLHGGNGSSSLGHPLHSNNGNNSSSSRLSQMQSHTAQLSGFNQQQPGALFGNASESAANQQQLLQTCYTVWGPLPVGGQYHTASTMQEQLLRAGSSSSNGACGLLPPCVDITNAPANVIPSLTLPATSTASPWMLQAGDSCVMNFTTPGTVNSGVEYGVPALPHMAPLAASCSMVEPQAVEAINAAAVQGTWLMHQTGAAAAAAAAAVATRSLQQQQQQQQSLQLLLQSHRTASPILNEQLGSTIGQQLGSTMGQQLGSTMGQQLGSTMGQNGTVLLPVTLLTTTASSAAAGGPPPVHQLAAQQAAPHSMPHPQQQQAVVLPTVAPSSTIALQQWLA